LKILEREQRNLLPSRVQLLLYYLLSIDAIILLFIWILDNLGDVLNVRIGWLNELISSRLLVALLIAGVALMLSNFRLIGKLFRHASLLRALGLRDSLRHLFDLRERPWQSFVWGSTLAVVSALSFVAIRLDPISAVALPFTGVALATSWYMQRSRQRLKIVQELQRSLAANRPHDDAENGSEPAILPSSSIDAIARIERTQIIRDRQQSLSEAKGGEEAQKYTLQLSNEVIRTKQSLDATTAAAVDRLLDSVMDAPLSMPSLPDQKTDLFVAAVPDAPWEICYKVDESSRRIRIFHLRPSSDV
jgi:hypothetical protein